MRRTRREKRELFSFIMIGVSILAAIAFTHTSNPWVGLVWAVTFITGVTAIGKNS